jgi:hypothetical protein
MTSRRLALTGLVASLVGALLLVWTRATRGPTLWSAAPRTPSALQKRWLFVWRDVSDPKEVDRMIARFPHPQADGSAKFDRQSTPALEAGASPQRTRRRFHRSS